MTVWLLATDGMVQMYDWVIIVVACFFWLGMVFYKIGNRYNGADWGSRSINLIDGFLRWFFIRWHRLKAKPVILPEGAALVVGNHISGMDPLLMIACCNRPVRFIIAREEYDRWWLRWLFDRAGCIPVDRTGKPHIAYREALKALEQGDVVGIFPSGRIVRPNETTKPIKAGATRLAFQAEAPVYPLYLDGVKAPGSVFLCLVLRGKVTVQQQQVLQPNLLDKKQMTEAIFNSIYK
ncbi:1-acyl-sn-glycerol-3-phosphate acyltransferase [Pelagibaculum spongiae]|uniref:1-acyl-sn-glycerol-3-phosphate acyltransferase n=2 Tax=Pelagibaculum spongiae TaxID=2080658 RepID=A0A2V1H5I6_9GAMM|nr:1-acyl-sn-glycerol-3-phosphate acyltransferase [Pelagibaculum spongiae]